MLSNQVGSVAPFVQSFLSVCSDTNSWKIPQDTFQKRHCEDPKSEAVKPMLEVIGVQSAEELIQKTIPKSIINDKILNDLDKKFPFKTREFDGESDVLNELLVNYADKNNYKMKSFIGQGYYGTKLPSVILRNVLENPNWYTPYTPYQAEVSQGRLESLMNYQTMISELTGFKISNASLLDEATAAAESMVMCYNLFTQKKRQIQQKRLPVTLVVDNLVHPQTLEVVKTRAGPFNIKIQVVDDIQAFFKSADKKQFEKAPLIGCIYQYPNTVGEVLNFSDMNKKVKKLGGFVVCASDLLALTILETPAKQGADVCIGSNQRFGLPMGYGGPSAGFFATSDDLKRSMPGRLIGLSKDKKGNPAYRMALQTREQHIRREKATSNICTAQALLSNLTSMYAIYHGPEGLKNIARGVAKKTALLAEGLKKLGYSIFDGKQAIFFDTIRINAPAKEVMDKCVEKGYNIRMINDNQVAISFDETTQPEDITNLLEAFASAAGKEVDFKIEDLSPKSPICGSKFERKGEFLQQRVFNDYHTEHEMARYLKRMEIKDISMMDSMISLGSCTMKLNAASEMIPITWPQFGNMHPFVPVDQAKGYGLLTKDLENWLSQITGFDACCLQPNAGSNGEYAGLMTIRQYFIANKQPQRNVCLIPISAHGTNPASAVMAAMKVEPVNCDKNGNVDIKDLEEKAKKHSKNLACLMITYPSTHGVFEEDIKEICKVVHKYGGKVYMDGANMNAQVGHTSPGTIGADVCHLNLHKTFAIPHGGGGPGMGPICCRKELAPYMPDHKSVKEFTKSTSLGPVAASPFGSASILPITWMYIRMLGGKGLKNATTMAILNANYMAKRLAPHFKVYYTGKNGFCAHEFILDLGSFKKNTGVEAEDVAKRLMDFGFHAPTLSFPIHETLMCEPCESESKEELDRLCDALIQIKGEINKIEQGEFDKEDNPLKGAPHTYKEVCANEWKHKYPRELAAFPAEWVRDRKRWPTVSRIDNVWGDINLICSCDSMKIYETLEVAEKKTKKE